MASWTGASASSPETIVRGCSAAMCCSLLQRLGSRTSHFWSTGPAGKMKARNRHPHKIPQVFEAFGINGVISAHKPRKFTGILNAILIRNDKNIALQTCQHVAACWLWDSGSAKGQGYRSRSFTTIFVSRNIFLSPVPACSWAQRDVTQLEPSTLWGSHQDHSAAVNAKIQANSTSVWFTVVYVHVACICVYVQYTVYLYNVYVMYMYIFEHSYLIIFDHISYLIMLVRADMWPLANILAAGNRWELATAANCRFPFVAFCVIGSDSLSETAVQTARKYVCNRSQL